MEGKSKLSVQNIIGRITHGLVGMDIFLNEKTRNEYLADFLTLKEDEIKEIFLWTSAQRRLIPSCELKLSDEENGFLECIRRAQEVVQKIDQIESDKEIENCINELGSKMDIIYTAAQQR
jgi:peptide subunit release factor 1 (eRF1)